MALFIFFSSVCWFRNLVLPLGKTDKSLVLDLDWIHRARRDVGKRKL